MTCTCMIKLIIIVLSHHYEPVLTAQVVEYPLKEWEVTDLSQAKSKVLKIIIKTLLLDDVSQMLH